MRIAALVLAVAFAGALLWWFGREQPLHQRAGGRGAGASAVAGQEPEDPLEEIRGAAAEGPLPDHAIRLRVTDQAGGPVAGISVEFVRGPSERRTESTDERGRAIAVRLEEDVYSVVIVLGPRNRHIVEQVDVRRGSRDLTYQLPPAREIVIRVSAEGVNGLPDGCRVSRPQLFDVTRDESEGILRGRAVLPPGRDWLRVRVRAPGYFSGRARVDVPTEGPVSAGVDLDPRLDLLLRSPDPEFRPWLGVTSWDESSKQWRYVQNVRGGSVAPQRTADGWLYEGLHPQRLRVTVGRLGIVLAERDLDGSGVVTWNLDLARIATVRGRVEGLEPRLLPQTTVLVSDSKRRGASVTLHVTPEGTFSALVPADRPVTFTVSHPMAIPDRDKLTTTGNQDGIVFGLRPTSLVVFRASFPNDLRMAQHLPMSVIYLDRQGRKTERRARYVAERERYEVAAPRPGRYRVLLDPGLAPILLEDVEIASDGADLGAFTFEMGSGVIVRLTRAGHPGYDVLLTSKTSPEFRRAGLLTTQILERTLFGLRPGRYRLRVRPGVMRTDQKGNIVHVGPIYDQDIDVPDSADPLVIEIEPK